MDHIDRLNRTIEYIEANLDKDIHLELLASKFALSKYHLHRIPNHVHILLRTGQTSLATVMSRLLTGYAVSYNRRHRRNGHLFQNRYKSILCQEDIYLL